MTSRFLSSLLPMQPTQQQVQQQQHLWPTGPPPPGTVPRSTWPYVYSFKDKYGKTHSYPGIVYEPIPDGRTKHNPQPQPTPPKSGHGYVLKPYPLPQQEPNIVPHSKTPAPAPTRTPAPAPARTPAPVTPKTPAPTATSKSEKRLSGHSSLTWNHSPTKPKSILKPPKILFAHPQDPYFSFTNFSPHPVFYDGKLYPTSQHLFEGFKYEDGRISEAIRLASPRPEDALAESFKYKHLIRPKWDQIKVDVMDLIVLLKFTQNPGLREDLIGTGKAELQENDTDKFWGNGGDGSGSNELGKCLMRLRQQLGGQ